MQYNHVEIVRQGNQIILPPGMSYNQAIAVFLEKKKHESTGIDRLKCLLDDGWRAISRSWASILRPSKKKEKDKMPVCDRWRCPSSD